MINEYAQKQIDYIKERCKEIKPLVVIDCITYNHEPYLKDALEGFVMQKTDFPFIAIVHEDASTDGTANVLKQYAEKYPYIIFPIYEKENQWSKKDGSLDEILRESKKVSGAKYIAICEGDDYWIDPLKLQKQVSFLESHPNYSMCYTAVNSYDTRNNKMIGKWGGDHTDFDALLMRNTVPTLTAVYRTQLKFDYYNDIDIEEKKKWKMGDYPLWLYIASKSKIKFIDEITGIYRILPLSASHNPDIKKNLEFFQNYRSISYYFANKFKSDKIIRIEDDLDFTQICLDILNNKKFSKKFFLNYFQTTKKYKRRILSLILLFSNSIAKIIINKTFK